MQATRIASVGCAVFIGLFARGVWGAPDSPVQATPKPAQASSPFFLGRAIPQTFVEFKIEELTPKWPYFEHAAFDSAGFCQVMLPFHYSTSLPAGSTNEALAFSFLLGNTLDWAPGCYCNRHAYYLFKKARDEMRRAQVTYDPESIRSLIEDWQCTHAIGGEIRRATNGFSGRLQVFDTRGVIRLNEAFDAPRDYFDLLGDMSVTAMRFFGYDPPTELKAFLRKKRCKDLQSIEDLGAAAFEGLRSEEEFRIYRQILDRDPDFAEVRWWYALQYYWKTYDRPYYNEQKYGALQSYLVERGLVDVNVEEWKDPQRAGQYEIWLRQAEQFSGKLTPDLLDVRLYGLARCQKPLTHEFLSACFQAAATYPNHGGLLTRLTRILGSDLGHDTLSACPYDPAMAVSLALSKFQCRFSVGPFGDADVARSVARALNELGRGELAVSFAAAALRHDLSVQCQNDSRLDALCVAGAMANMRCYEEVISPALTHYELAEPDSSERGSALTLAGVSAILAGRLDLAQKITDRYKEAAFGRENYALFQAWLRAATNTDRSVGEPEGLKSLPTESPQPREAVWRFPFVLLLKAELDLRAGHANCRELLAAYLRRQPIQKWIWVLYDAYDRAEPRPESSDFYCMMEWLNGDDPWVKEAVAAFRQRVKAPPPTDADRVVAALANFPALPWPVIAASLPSTANAKVFQELPPGAVSTAVKTLIDREQFEKAQDLCLRGLAAAVALNEFSMSGHMNFLYHKAEQARREKIAADAATTTRAH